MLVDLIVLRGANGRLLEEGSVPTRGRSVPAIASGSWALAAPPIPVEASTGGAAQHVPLGFQLGTSHIAADITYSSRFPCVRASVRACVTPPVINNDN